VKGAILTKRGFSTRPRGFISVFRGKASGFHRLAKLFELKFFVEKLSSRL